MATGGLATATSTSTSTARARIDRTNNRESQDSETPLLQNADDARRILGPLEGAEAEERMSKLIQRMKIQIWAGMGSGLLIATGIGAAFIAVVSLSFYPDQFLCVLLILPPVLPRNGKPVVGNGTNMGRCILSHRLCIDIHHGHRFPQDGSIKDQMAIQTRSGF